MTRVRAVLVRNTRNAAENRIDKEESRAIIFIMKNVEHADETSKLGKGWQREKPQAASFLFRNLLKTTSEWLQNSPVIPLSS